MAYLQKRIISYVYEYNNNNILYYKPVLRKKNNDRFDGVNYNKRDE